MKGQGVALGSLFEGCRVWGLRFRVLGLGVRV